MKLTTLILALALVGCASPQKTPQTWGEQITYKRDPYTRISTVEGGSIKNDMASVHLRAARPEDDVKEPTIAVYASMFYSDNHWHYYDTARTTDGKAWPVKIVRRDVMRCSGRYRCMYGELVLVEMPRSYLNTVTGTGMKMRISGVGGAKEFVFPPDYVSTFMARVALGR